MIARIFIIISVLLSLLSCKPDSQKEQAVQSLPADFELFFEKFHTDSLFQLAHIVFPLEGIKKINGGPGDVLVPIHWNPDEWIMHRPFNDYNRMFTRSYRIIGPVIVEYITDNNQFFSMERRFAKIDGEWHLIYYGLKK